MPAKGNTEVVFKDNAILPVVEIIASISRSFSSFDKQQSKDEVNQADLIAIAMCTPVLVLPKSVDAEQGFIPFYAEIMHTLKNPTDAVDWNVPTKFTLDKGRFIDTGLQPSI